MGVGNLQLSGFLQGAGRMGLQLMQFEQNRASIEASIAAEKDRLKLLQQRVKGQEAEHTLRQAMLNERARKSLEQSAQLQRLLSGGISGLGTAPGTQEAQMPEGGVATILGLAEPEDVQAEETDVQVRPRRGAGEGAAIDRLLGLQQQLLPFAATEEGSRALSGVRNTISTLRAQQDQRRTARLGIRQGILREPSFRDLAGARQGFNTIEAGFRAQNNFGDLAMINGLARMLDPGSVVRPAEFATVQAARGLLEQMRGAFARVFRGEQLTTQERIQIRTLAQRILGNYISEVVKQVGPVFRPLAEEARIPFRELFVDPRITANIRTDAQQTGKGSGREMLGVPKSVPGIGEAGTLGPRSGAGIGEVIESIPVDIAPTEN